MLGWCRGVDGAWDGYGLCYGIIEDDGTDCKVNGGDDDIDDDVDGFGDDYCEDDNDYDEFEILFFITFMPIVAN